MDGEKKRCDFGREFPREPCWGVLFTSSAQTALGDTYTALVCTGHHGCLGGYHQYDLEPYYQGKAD